jgi:hypothetical protein
MATQISFIMLNVISVALTANWDLRAIGACCQIRVREGLSDLWLMCRLLNEEIYHEVE